MFLKTTTTTTTAAGKQPIVVQASVQPKVDEAQSVLRPQSTAVETRMRSRKLGHLKTRCDKYNQVDISLSDIIALASIST